MGIAKRLDLFPEEQIIQDAINDGRCNKQPLSMKVLGEPDAAFQSRAEHINVLHMQKLEQLHRDGKELAPVVVFMAIINGVARYILADGFHRHAALKHAKATSITAYVIECAPSRLEHEARVYSAVCNRRFSLARTLADKRKAVEMLCSDSECVRWPTKRIAEYCDVSPETAKNYRQEYLVRNKLDIPEEIIPFRGTKAKRTVRTTPRGVNEQPVPNRPAILKPAPRSIVSVGPEVEPTTDDRPPLVNLRNFREWLLRRKVLAESSPNANELPGVTGMLTATRSIVLSASVLTNDLCAAIGKALVFHARFGEQRIPTVILYDEAADKKIIAAAKKKGFEFLSPMELVAAEKRA